MYDNNKFNKHNKRRRSYTEFRTSYSDNKKYFISTDKTNKWSSVIKYFMIGVALAAVVLVGFIITDALLEISEEPYKSAEPTTQEEKTYIDQKYFDNQVTIPADKVETSTDSDPSLE